MQRTSKRFWNNYEKDYIDKGNTEYVAEFVQELTGADMFKVEPSNYPVLNH